MYIMLQLLD
jgi:hypothetical protein